MPYVNRVDGVVRGVAQWPQDGWDNDKLSRDDPEVIAYMESITVDEEE